MSWTSLVGPYIVTEIFALNIIIVIWKPLYATDMITLFQRRFLIIKKGNKINHIIKTVNKTGSC